MSLLVNPNEKNSLMSMKIKSRFTVYSPIVSITFNLVLVFICVFKKCEEKSAVFKNLMFIRNALAGREALLIFRAGLWELNFSGA